MTIINSIKKLRSGKVRVIFDGENAVDILAESILEYNITEGISICNTKWNEIYKASRNRLAIREALNFLSKKRRTTGELEQWLQKSFSNNETLHATERMQELKYLNDESWVLDYQKSQKARGKSKRYLANEFKKKNISAYIQAKALDRHNDEIEALWLAHKKFKSLEKLPFDRQKTKLYFYLQRRGFNNELIISITRQLILDN